MQNIFANRSLRRETLFATLALVLALSRSAHAQDISDDPSVSPPADAASTEVVGGETANPVVEMEASLDLSGGGFGTRFGIGRVFGEHVVLMGSAGFNAYLDDRPELVEFYGIEGRVSLKLYARAPRVHAVAPSIMTSFTYRTGAFKSNDGTPWSRTHDVGGQLHAGATYFATPALGFQLRTGVGLNRAVGDVFRHGWSLASTTELGITLRF